MKIDNLIYKVKDTEILNIDKLKIEDNQNIGIFGRNGAGKTSLIKCILNVVKYKGNIDVGDRKNIEVLMQKNNYPMYARCIDIIRLVLGIKKTDSINDLIELLNFKECLNKEFRVLSGGEHQKLNLILVLSRKPDLLFLDEVTTGLDTISRKTIIRFIKNYMDKNNARLILISHYEEELKLLTDKVIILEKGRVKEVIDSNNIDTFIEKEEIICIN